MKKLSETLTELGIDFSFPIEIKDSVAVDSLTLFKAHALSVQSLMALVWLFPLSPDK